MTPETLPHHQGALIIADAFKRFKVEQEYGMGVIQGRFGVPSNYTMYQEEAHKMLHEILPDNTMDEDDRVMYYESGQQRWVLNGSGEMWQVFRTNLGRRPAVTGDWQYGDKIMVRDADAQPFFEHAWLLPKGKLPRVPPGMKWEQRRMIDEAAGSAITDDLEDLRKYVPETGRIQSFWTLVHDVTFFSSRIRGLPTDPAFFERVEESVKRCTVDIEREFGGRKYERERAMTNIPYTYQPDVESAGLNKEQLAVANGHYENFDWEERGDDWQRLGTASSSQPEDHDGRADDHGRWRRARTLRDAPYPPSRPTCANARGVGKERSAMTDSPTPQEAPSTATQPAPQGLSCDHHGIVSPMGLTALWQIGDTYRTILTNESAIELPTRTVDGAAWVPAGEPGLFRLVAKPTRQVMTFQQRDPTTYTDDSPSVPFLTEGRV